MVGGVMALALHTGKVHINTYPGRAGQSNISFTEISECNVYSIHAVYCTQKHCSAMHSIGAVNLATPQCSALVS